MSWQGKAGNEKDCHSVLVLPVKSCPSLKSVPSLSWALGRHNRLVSLWKVPLGLLRAHTEVWLFFFFFFPSVLVKLTCPHICNNSVWPWLCRMLHSYISWCLTCQTLNDVNGTFKIKKYHWDSTTDICDHVESSSVGQKRYGETWYLAEIRTRKHCDRTDNDNVKDMEVVPLFPHLRK